MTYPTPEPGLLAIGARVRRRREELGLTQDELAKQAGVSRTSVTNVEMARQGMSQKAMRGFSAALGFAVSDLLPEPSEAPADLEAPPMPEPKSDLRRHTQYLLAIVRCQVCGHPIEREGDYVKSGWQYWDISCWPEGES